VDVMGVQVMFHMNEVCMYYFVLMCV
jgi:hypothetical protein